MPCMLALLQPYTITSLPTFFTKQKSTYGPTKMPFFFYLSMERTHTVIVILFIGIAAPLLLAIATVDVSHGFASALLDMT
eukprot:14077284-Ditylum_brightwellii.AAC.1